MILPHTLSFKDSSINKEILLDFHAIKKAQLLYRAMNNPVRKKILSLIDSKNKMTVSALTLELRMEQPIISQHIAILRKANLLNSSRVGKFIWYSINYRQIEKVIQLTSDLLKR